MRAGTLNRFVAVRRLVEIGRDGLNQPITQLQTVREFWAERIHQSETEPVAASQLHAVRVVAFRARWFDGLLATDKLVSDGVTYDVLGWREIGFHEGIEITAKAIE